MIPFNTGMVNQYASDLTKSGKNEGVQRECLALRNVTSTVPRVVNTSSMIVVKGTHWTQACTLLPQPLIGSLIVPCKGLNDYSVILDLNIVITQYARLH